MANADEHNQESSCSCNVTIK